MTVDKPKDFAETLVDAFEQAKENCFPLLEGETLAALDLARMDLLQALRVPAPIHSEDFPDMRDQMAIATLPAIIEANKENMKISFEGEAEQAYKYADAMIKARKATGASTPEGAA